MIVCVLDCLLRLCSVGREGEGGARWHRAAQEIAESKQEGRRNAALRAVAGR